MTRFRDDATRPTVGLLVTCLVDLFRPNIGFAAVELIRRAGFEVEVPQVQTCCGQPAYNSGDRASTRGIARQVIAAFEGYDYLVAPSGSCVGMVREHYPKLFSDDPETRRRAEALSARAHELTSFLTEVCEVDISARFAAAATYHDSCAGLRELGIKAQPRSLLARVEGLRLVEMEDSEVCCGFGGTFCVKYPGISARMADDKAADITATGANCVLGGDLGCLLNIAGRIRRLGGGIRVFHVAEVLAGLADGPAIGEDSG